MVEVVTSRNSFSVGQKKSVLSGKTKKSGDDTDLFNKLREKNPECSAQEILKFLNKTLKKTSTNKKTKIEEQIREIIEGNKIRINSQDIKLFDEDEIFSLNYMENLKQFDKHDFNNILKFIFNRNITALENLAEKATTDADIIDILKFYVQEITLAKKLADKYRGVGGISKIYDDYSEKLTDALSDSCSNKKQESPIVKKYLKDNEKELAYILNTPPITENRPTTMSREAVVEVEEEGNVSDGSVDVNDGDVDVDTVGKDGSVEVDPAVYYQAQITAYDNVKTALGVDNSLRSFSIKSEAKADEKADEEANESNLSDQATNIVKEFSDEVKKTAIEKKIKTLDNTKLSELTIIMAELIKTSQNAGVEVENLKDLEDISQAIKVQMQEVEQKEGERIKAYNAFKDAINNELGIQLPAIMDVKQIDAAITDKHRDRITERIDRVKAKNNEYDPPEAILSGILITAEELLDKLSNNEQKTQIEAIKKVAEDKWTELEKEQIEKAENEKRSNKLTLDLLEKQGKLVDQQIETAKKQSDEPSMAQVLKEIISTMPSSNTVLWDKLLIFLTNLLPAAESSLPPSSTSAAESPPPPSSPSAI